MQFRRWVILAVYVAGWSSVSYAQDIPNYTVNTLWEGGSGADIRGQVAVAPDGTIYFNDQTKTVIQKIATDGTISVFAGGGTAHTLIIAHILAPPSTFPATDANLGLATNVAVDPDGNVYISLGTTIWKTTPDGTMSLWETVVTPGGVPDVGFDADGNGYIRSGLSGGTSIIKKIVTGDTLTVAGGNGRDNTGDGGPATAATLDGLGGMAIGPDGSIWFYSADATIRKISTDGTINTVAGTPGQDNPISGKAIFAGESALELIFDDSGSHLVTDGKGNLFFTPASGTGDNVNLLTADGKVYTLGGIGDEGFAGDGGPASDAEFSNITGLAIDSSGVVYVADWGNNRIRTLTPDGPFGGSAGGGDAGGDTGSTASGAFVPGGLHETVAGSGGTGFGNGGFSGDGGPATDATLTGPAGLYVNAAGDLYISDSQNNRIRKVTAATGNIETIAGTGVSDVFAGDGGQALVADIPFPGSIVVDADGNVYTSTSGRVIKIDASGLLTVLAGNGGQAFSGDGGAATDAEMFFPSGIALDSDGDLYIADTNNHRIRKVDIATGLISTFAGDGATSDEFGTGTFAGDGGPATDASFNRPAAIDFDSAGNLYVVDRENNRVRMIDTSGNVETIAGNGEFAFSGNGGPATDAALASPFGISVDGAGNVFITDTQNQQVRMVTTDGTIVTAAGSGEGGFASAGFDGDSGNGLEAMFNFPITATTDAAGNLYVADQNNHRIRKFAPGDGTGGSDGGDGSGDGDDTGTNVELPSGDVGPMGLDLDTANGDQMVRQATPNPTPGDDVTVDVFVTAGASSAIGFAATLAWDPAALTYKSFTATGVYVGGAPLTTPSSISAADSTATFQTALFSGAPSTDSGSAGHITFTVNEGYTGTTTVRLTEGKLASTVLDIGPGAAFVVITAAEAVALTPAQAANFDGDGTVGFQDFLVFAGGFGSSPGSANWDPRLDLDGDGTVGFLDFLEFAAVFGQSI